MMMMMWLVDDDEEEGEERKKIRAVLLDTKSVLLLAASWWYVCGGHVAIFLLRGHSLMVVLKKNSKHNTCGIADRFWVMILNPFKFFLGKALSVSWILALEKLVAILLKITLKVNTYIFYDINLP